MSSARGSYFPRTLPCANMHLTQLTVMLLILRQMDWVLSQGVASGPQQSVRRCFQSSTSVTLDCSATEPKGHIHLQKVIYDHAADAAGACVEAPPTLCHVDVSEELERPLFLTTCELRHTCSVPVSATDVQLRCGANATVIAVDYVCLHGPPQRTSCMLGTVCASDHNWTLTTGPNADLGWETGGQAATHNHDGSHSHDHIASPAAGGLTSTAPSLSHFFWDHDSTTDQTIGNRRRRSSSDLPPSISVFMTKEPHVAYLVSPNYPHNYTGYRTGVCHAQTEAGASIHLLVNRFHLERHHLCIYDWLRIETGYQSVLLCDTILPGSSKTLASDWLKFKFSSDARLTDIGFLLSISAVSDSGDNKPLALWCGQEHTMRWYMNSIDPAEVFRTAVVSDLVSEKVPEGATDVIVTSAVVVAIAVGACLIVLLLTVTIYICKKKKQLSVQSPSDSRPAITTVAMPPAYSLEPYYSGSPESEAAATALPVKDLFVNPAFFDLLPEKTDSATD